MAMSQEKDVSSPAVKPSSKDCDYVTIVSDLKKVSYRHHKHVLNFVTRRVRNTV